MTKDISVAQTKVPAFLKVDKPVGNENVSTQDMQTPRLKLLQSMSPEIDSGSQYYVEGAKAGHIYNTVTGDLMDSVNCVNVYYDRDYAVYEDRSFGTGGFQGTFPTEAAAREQIKALDGKPGQYVVRDTAKHMLILLDDKGDPKIEALCLMDGTKLLCSDKWNTKLSMLKVNRFDSVWQLSTVRNENSKGHWFNYDIDFVGYVDEELHNYAESLYQRVAPAMLRSDAA